MVFWINMRHMGIDNATALGYNRYVHSPAVNHNQQIADLHLEALELADTNFCSCLEMAF
jgi:hypothetical protein